jgi:hypothetical protein
MTDVDVDTGDLQQFAGENFQVDLGATGRAAATVGVVGKMAEAQQLAAAAQHAGQDVLKYLTAVQQGMDGYRVGIGKIAAVYDSTEASVIDRLRKLKTPDNLPSIDPRAGNPGTEADSRDQANQAVENARKGGN